MIGKSSEPCGQFPSSIAEILGTWPTPPRGRSTPAHLLQTPPALAGARARRAARRHRAHAAPRRRAAARARLRHRVDARQRRRVPTRGGHAACRRCCSPTTRRSPWRSACASRRRAGLRGAEHTTLTALAKLEQVLPPALRRRVDALASQPRSACSARDAARSPGARGRRRAARPARPRLPRLRAGAVHATRLPRASRRRASSSRTRSCPSNATGTSWRWDRQREDWRTFRVDRISDVFQTRVHFEPRPMSDEAARARVETALRWRDRSVRARVVIDLPQGRPRRPPRLVRSRRRGRRSQAAACGRSRPTRSRTS